MESKLPRLAFALGLSGLIPQLLANGLVLFGSNPKLGLLAGLLYAALILSFLGGLWWGVSATRPDAPHWLFAAAVFPSLIAFGAGFAWIADAPMALPYATVGFALLATPLVDRDIQQRGYVPKDWLKMRIILSVGLGLLTLSLAIRA